MTDIDYSKLSNEELMKIVNSSPSEEANQPSNNFLSNALQGYGNYATGAARGIGQSLGDMGASAINWPISGIEHLISKHLPHVPHPNLLNKNPHSLGESLGQNLGSFAGNIIPGLVGGGTPQLISKGAPLIAKLLAGGAGGALAGAAFNEDNRNLGAITGGALGGAGASIPSLAKAIGNYQSKNVAQNIPQTLKNLKSEYGTKFDTIINQAEEAGANKFIKPEEINIAILKKAGARDKLIYALEEYKKNPTLRTSHEAQSALGKILKNLPLRKEKVDIAAAKIAEKAQQRIHSNISQSLEKSGVPDLSEEYFNTRAGYGENVGPYLESSAIRKLEKGELRPKKFANELVEEEKFMSKAGHKHPELRQRELLNALKKNNIAKAAAAGFAGLVLPYELRKLFGS